MITVIGLGVMGVGIAFSFARCGMEVVGYDQDPSRTEALHERILSMAELFVEEGLLEAAAPQQIAGRVRTATSLAEAVKGCEMVVEAVLERLEVKQALFAELDRLVPPNTILASNTSTMSIADIAHRVRARGRCITTHWVHPPQIMPLVEVAPGPETDSAVTERTVDLLRRAGKQPAQCADTLGLLNNRLQSLLLMEAVSLVERGVATPEAIDTAIKNGFGLRLATTGPLEFMDISGLQTQVDARDSMYRQSGDPRFRPPELLRKLVREGSLGLKTKKGFYDYDEAKANRITTGRDRALLRILKARNA